MAKIIAQLFSGGFEEACTDFQTIEGKLESLYSRTPLDAVIMGWSLEPELYAAVREYLKPRGTELYLWFPVFSELGYFKEFQTVADLKGKPAKSFSLQPGENFEFYCPLNRENMLNVKEIYEKYFSGIGFDGIFLDKIRYPSFSNGIESIFTCFCDDCRAKMLKSGFNLDKFEDCAGKVLDNGVRYASANPLGIKSYNNLMCEFEDKIWEEFFDFKAANIYEAVSELHRHFSSKSLKVGLDVLSPFFGYFSGQRIDLLSRCADFIKPMFYRATSAPAGLPFELGMYINGVSNGNRNIYNEIRKSILGILNLESFNGRVIDVKFTLQEMNHLLNSESSKNTFIFPGIEINRKDGIAPIYPPYIEENASMLKRMNCDGAVLSWDLLSFPEDNLEAFARTIQ